MSVQPPTRWQIRHALVYALGLVSMLAVMGTYVAGILFAIASDRHTLAVVLILIPLAVSFLFRKHLG